MSQVILPKFQNFLALASLALSHACSNSATPDPDATMKGTRPSDSSGQIAGVQLSFASESAAGLKLSSASIDLGNALILTDVRINIGKIKIKPAASEDENEKSLKESMASRKKELERSHEFEKAKGEADIKSLEEEYKNLFTSANSEIEKADLRRLYELEKTKHEQAIAQAQKQAEEDLDTLEAEQDPDLRWKGPYVLDLVSGSVSPELPATQIFDGSYHRLQFQLKPNRTADDSLLNKSILIKGTTNWNGSISPFVFTLAESAEFQVISKDGYSLPADTDNRLLVMFQPKLWFDQVNLSQASQDSSGVILIDSEHNKDLYLMIRAQIKASTRAGHDRDGDGQLKSSELDGETKDDVGSAEDAES